MVEYKQYPPANHFHLTWNLPVSRLEYWMDLTCVRSETPWAARPKFIEGVDRPQPLVNLLSGK
jgi:L-fucose isomerase